MRNNKWRFQDYYLYFYFREYECYNLISERGSVPALTRDGDLWDSILNWF